MNTHTFLLPLKQVVASTLLMATMGMASAQTQGSEPAYHFEIAGLKNDTVYLANYYGEKLYYADTALADAQGIVTFAAVPPEEEGKYAVVIPGPKFFEVILAGGESVRIKTDTTDLTGHATVLQSENNKVMYAYIDFLSERRKEREALLKELEANEGNPAVTSPLKTNYNALNEKVKNYQLNVYKTHPDLFAAKEIGMAVEPEPPAELLGDKLAAYYWYRDHYFDRIDLQDDRMVRSPIFAARLENYLNNTLAQAPDTLTYYIDKLVQKLDPGSEMYKYVVHFTTYNFETSKIMGMDEVFVHMVDTYYKTGHADWMTEEQLKKITEKADDKRKTLIGLKVPELTLADSTGKWISTVDDLHTPYTLLYFYDPDCGHCKKETPKLVEWYDQYDQDKLAIYAVSSDNGDKWRKFVKNNHMQDFYNVSIPQQAYDDAAYATTLITSGKTNYESLKYQETFDVFSTPKVILLDENHVIKAKDIGVDQLGEVLQKLEELAAAKQEKN